MNDPFEGVGYTCGGSGEATKRENERERGETERERKVGIERRRGRWERY